MDIINYINRHLSCRNADIKLIRFLPVHFSGQSRYHEIAAYNQYLFLKVADLPVGMEITGDNNAIEISDSRNLKNTIEEFTGLVTMEFTQGSYIGGTWTVPKLEGTIEFIQVILK